MSPHTSNAKDYLAQTGYKGSKFYREGGVVKSGNLTTAPVMNPLEFAREIFATLNIYSDKVLSAWYNLYKTGDAKYFADLANANKPDIQLNFFPATKSINFYIHFVFERFWNYACKRMGNKPARQNRKTRGSKNKSSDEGSGTDAGSLTWISKWFRFAQKSPL